MPPAHFCSPKLPGLYCEHANESPALCECPPACQCFGHCLQRGAHRIIAEAFGPDQGLDKVSRLSDRIEYLIGLLAEIHPRHPQPNLCVVCKELKRV